MQAVRTFRHAVFASLVVLAASGVSGFAATLTVTNLGDSGAGSLRGLLASAASGDTIVFAPGVTGTIPLATSLSIALPVTIQGPGATLLTLDGQNTVRVIDVIAGSLTLSGVTIARGNSLNLGGGINVGINAPLTVSNTVFAGNNASNGGGISSSGGGALTIDACTFQNNSTTSVGGGAFLTSGATTVSNSTFAGNTAPLNGGAINVQSNAILTLVNSTLSNSTSSSLGGAISNLGTMTIVNSTIAGSHASGGAAIASGNNNVTINNSVLVDNAATAGTGGFSGGTFTASNNVFFNNTNAGTPDDLTGYGSSNFVHATAQPLAVLGNYGGPTQTMLPLSGGAAICAGSAALIPVGLTRDQRGLPRTTSYGGPACVDAGAVQVQNVIATPTMSMPMLALLCGLLAMFGLSRFRAEKS